MPLIAAIIDDVSVDQEEAGRISRMSDMLQPLLAKLRRKNDSRPVFPLPALLPHPHENTIRIPCNKNTYSLLHIDKLQPVHQLLTGQRMVEVYGDRACIGLNNRHRNGHAAYRI